MRTQEKYNLAEMLKEIDDDMHEQKKDLRQGKKHSPGDYHRTDARESV
ncbi:MAG: hypothetical protein R2861_03400 [Desulfobacterales bacterium]